MKNVLNEAGSLLIFLNQNIRRNAKTIVQFSYHRNSQRPDPIEYFCNSTASADKWFKVFSGQVLLFHNKF